FEKKHGQKIKFNGKENARFDKKLVKCFNCKKMGHFSRECQAQGGQNSDNYQKYKEAGKDGTDSKAMVVVDGSIDWDKQTEEGNTESISLENLGMLAGIKLESDADLKGEVVSADDVIPAAISISAGPVAATAAVSPHSKIEFAFMGLSTEECLRPIHSDHDSKASISSISAPASESRDTIVIDCARKEDFPSVCTSSIKFDVKSSNTLYNKFVSFNKESHFRKHKSVASKSCYVCGSYLHLIKDRDFHEQRFAKRNVERKGILKSRPTGKPVNPNRPKLVVVGRPKHVYAGRPNPVSAGRPNAVSAGRPNPISVGRPNHVSALKKLWLLVTSAGRVIFYWLIVIPPGDLVPAGG
nr:hypothetical protein [Tanacetum cinerariifolium]